jgi:hypothetical protein
MIKSELAKADIGSEVYNNLMDNLSDMSRLTTSVNDAIKLGLDIPQDAVQQMFETIFDQGNLPEDMYNDMIQKFIEDFKEKTGQDLKVGVNGSLSGGKRKSNPHWSTDEDGKTTVKITSLMSGISSSISQMTSGIEALGIELPSGLNDVVKGIQGVTSILMGINALMTVIAAIQGTKAIPIVGWALANGGVVHAAGGYTVPGDYSSGDLVPAMLNSGEVVLNRAQQGVIANALQQEPRGGGNGVARVSGEQIWVALNAFTKRTGKGELVTWK